MDVEFREIDFFNVWIWVEFATVPSTIERQYVEEAFDSWFFLGKLGGFNAENLQVQETGLELSYLNYSEDAAEQSFMALMHNMGGVEFLGLWARCWFDLGTSDAIALDVLINTFRQLSRDYVEIKQLIIGGQNEDWPIPDTAGDTFYDADANRLAN